MRISTGYQYSAQNEHISAATERLYEAGRVVSTGMNLQEPSDDPVAAALVLGLQTALANNVQYQKNILSVQNRLKSTDNALADVTGLMNEARTLVLQGANSSTEQSSRDAMAAQISRVQERLVAIGNSQFVQGQYLFSGIASSAKPFSVVGNALTYNGSANEMSAQIQNGTIVQASVVGDPLFTDIYNALERTKLDLQGGDLTKLSNYDLAELDRLGKDLLAQRGDLGTLIKQVSDTNTDLGKQQDSLKTLIADHREADLPTAIAEYQAAQNAYQAALAAASSSMRLSLLDFLSGR